MQLGDPSVLEISSGESMMAVTPPPPEATATAASATVATEVANDINDNSIAVGMDATNSGDDIEKRSSGGGAGNRWPRQETFALLKIRSDMDAMFRDSSLKGPLWEEVSRKLAELGYNRSAKKCKEKFENVYKYHKRTKESRSGKSEGKTYKFFDQLQALENQFTISHTSSKPPPPPQPQPHLKTQSQPQLPFQTRPSNDLTTTISYVVTARAATAATATATATTTTTVPSTINPVPNINTTVNNPRNLPNMNFFSTTTTATTTSTSSSTASDEDTEERYRKKRKLKDYFRRLTRQVLAKQEEMQKRFLEAIDKRERERAAQQEAWRVHEMARINREHDILVQERSTAAAKDAAVIAFLQKLSGGGQQNPTPPPTNPSALPPRAVQQVVQLQPREQQPQAQVLPNINNNDFEIQKANMNNGHQSGSSSSSSRWPKAEVHALIRLRTSLDPKYQENGPKGPLWEDISAGMQRLGYNRSAKRCKEKWENINKYFKKVKESNKQRREDSKTCPYFHELDALYKEKTKANNTNTVFKASHEMLMEPLMVQPEQQWRPPPLEEGGGGRENANNIMQQRPEELEEEEEEEEEDDDMEEDGESMEEDQEGRYEIAATTNNKLPSVDTVE